MLQTRGEKRLEKILHLVGEPIMLKQAMSPPKPQRIIQGLVVGVQQPKMFLLVGEQVEKNYEILLSLQKHKRTLPDPQPGMLQVLGRKRLEMLLNLDLADMMGSLCLNKQQRLVIRIRRLLRRQFNQHLVGFLQP